MFPSNFLLLRSKFAYWCRLSDSSSVMSEYSWLSGTCSELPVWQYPISHVLVLNFHTTTFTEDDFRSLIFPEKFIPVPQVLNSSSSFFKQITHSSKNVATHWMPLLEILHILCIRELPSWRTILLLSNYPILNAWLLKLSSSPLECMISSGMVNCRRCMGSVRCCNVIWIWLSVWTAKFSRRVIKTSGIDNGAQSRKSLKQIGVSRTPSRPARFDHGGS